MTSRPEIAALAEGDDRHPVLCEFMPLSLVPLENPNHDPGEHQVMDSDTAYVFRICGSRERAENIVACLNAYAATPTPPSADVEDETKCECGFLASACRTNPCYRKKTATSGLVPNAKYPDLGHLPATRAVSEIDAELLDTKNKIIALIREGFDPEPNDWPRHRGWDDGAGEIAEKIIAVFQHSGGETTQTVETCPRCNLKADSLLHKFCTHSQCPIRSSLIQSAAHGGVHTPTSDSDVASPSILQLGENVCVTALALITAICEDSEHEAIAYDLNDKVLAFRKAARPQKTELPMRDPIIFWYRNHRGKEAYRRVIPIELREGTSEYYPEKQWLLRAYDLEKEAIREFALAKMSGVVGTIPLLFEGGVAASAQLMRARDERSPDTGKTDGDPA